MFVYLLFIIVISAQPEDFVTFGLKSNFSIMENTFEDCLDILCYDIVCNKLNNASLCINYMTIVLMFKDMNCSKFSSSTTTNIILSTIDPNMDRKISNEHKEEIWILLTGQCYYVNNYKGKFRS